MTDSQGAPPEAPAPIHPRATTYSERVAKFGAEATRLGAKSRLVSNLRGVTFAALVGSAIYWMTGDSRDFAVLLTALSVLAFLALVALHGRVIREEGMALRWVTVNRNAQLRTGPNYRELPDTGEEFRNAIHPYADDLDLFGPGSLFQRINVARTEFGQKRLAAFLMNRADVREIQRRQEAVRELAGQIELRQELEALALAVAEPMDPKEAGASRTKKRPTRLDAEPLLAWAERKPALSSKQSLVWVARISPPLTLAWVAYCFFREWHAATWLAPLIAQAILLLSVRVITAQVFAAVSTYQGVFLRFGPMLGLLEQMEPKSEFLKELKAMAQSEGQEPPSSAMRRFERIVSWFELRHNGLVHPFINGLLLWDIHCVLRLEQWQARSGRNLRQWFQALGEFEAISSLATFYFDNPDYCFAELEEGEARFVAEGLTHPLLDPRSRVRNTVELGEAGRGLLVTGSNMSGKSTLLRAMGVNAVLAQAGAPCCAVRLQMTPLALRTSMRISDSLDQGVSHFYAEVRKLQGVLSALSGAVPVFFLLDEILHGTNSRERQIGARWVLGELLRRGAIGAVSTHDDGLCQLPEPLMQQVDQVHLRETVEEDKMTFDYRLREGPVKSGNALRLMRSIGIGVPLE